MHMRAVEHTINRGSCTHHAAWVNHTENRCIHQRSEGLRNHYFLVERQSGQIRIIGLWDSPEALEAALATLEPARARLWEEFGEDPTLEAYEVADELRESDSAGAP